ncbi:MAG: energy transducer TonB [Deltaproteobacteria bacterium]|nr:energy transducer TonB [Deltaproteobacteria bacterium]
MSTKTFRQTGPAGQQVGYTGNEKVIFLLASLVIHAGLLWIFISSQGFTGEFRIFSPFNPAPLKKTPIFVDIVELLPSAKGEAKEPEKPTIFANRPNRVEKEITARPRPYARRTIPPHRQAMKRPVAPNHARAQEKKPEKGPAEGYKKGEGGMPRTTQPTGLAGQPTGLAGQPAGLAGGIQPDTGTKEVGGTVVRLGAIPGVSSGQPAGLAGDRGSGGSGGPGGRAGASGNDSPLSLFPTDERIAELSESYEKEPQKGETGKVLSLNTSELRYYGYLLNMKQRIEFYWDYPDSSAKRGEQGKLTVDFTITRSGGVEGVKIVKSSNYPALDDAAITAIRLASPFSQFPENFDINRVNIHASFEYRMYSR